jgi:hypothetical protein
MDDRISDFESVVPDDHRKDILELIRAHEDIRDKYEEGSIFIKGYIENIVFSHIISLTEADIKKVPVEMSEEKMMVHIDAVHKTFTVPILRLIDKYNDLLAKEPAWMHLEVEVEEIRPKAMWLGDYHFAGVYMLTIVTGKDTVKVVFINAVKQGDTGAVMRESVIYGGSPASLRTVSGMRRITAEEITAIWG